MGRDYEAAVPHPRPVHRLQHGIDRYCDGEHAGDHEQVRPGAHSYLIVPLSGVNFIDIMNAFLLTATLALPFMGG